MAAPAKESSVYELYVVKQSNIAIRQGTDPENPANTNNDFFVGDVFQGKVSSEQKGYIQLRAASRANKKQWIEVSEASSESGSIKCIVPPSVGEYYHLDIGGVATAKLQQLSDAVSRAVDSAFGVNLSALSGVIVTYLPFCYPLFTVNGTLFRGRGHFTQFCVPYFHSKSHAKEYLRRVEELRESTLSGGSEEEQAQREFAYEKKLMMERYRRMRDEVTNDPQASEEEKALHAMEDEEREEQEALDARALNEIVSVAKGTLPKWIQNVYASIASSKGYFYRVELYFVETEEERMVPLKQDEYLEQNQYSDFTLDDGDFWNARPRLVAFKTGQSLSDLIEVNEANGSRWFDVEFDPAAEEATEDSCQIYHEKAKLLRCKVGGKWQEARSRHYVDVKDENGDIFKQHRPMLVINICL